MYFGLEMIQEYACGGDYVPCDAGYTIVREYLHGDPARYPEVVAMVTYDLIPTEVPYGDPPAPPTSVNPQAYHYLHDVLGSVIGLVDEDSELVERYTYDPYGRPLIEKWDAAANEGNGAWVESATECGTGNPACGQMPYSSVGNPFMWTGHRHDAAVGLYHTLFRFYDPSLGRWLQRDPIEYDSGSINLYEYVRSAPLFWIDPLGLRVVPPPVRVDPPVPLVPPGSEPGSNDSEIYLPSFERLEPQGTDPFFIDRTFRAINRAFASLTTPKYPWEDIGVSLDTQKAIKDSSTTMPESYGLSRGEFEKCWKAMSCRCALIGAAFNRLLRDFKNALDQIKKGGRGCDDHLDKNDIRKRSMDELRKLWNDNDCDNKNVSPKHKPPFAT